MYIEDAIIQCAARVGNGIGDGRHTTTELPIHLELYTKVRLTFGIPSC
jgi:hypothetical protein